jgi:hypothetical protein
LSSSASGEASSSRRLRFTEEIAWPISRGQVLKIKIEVDTDPPPGFVTENKFILQPIPFSVRTFVLPDLFAGKMHAVLCRDSVSESRERQVAPSP